MTIPGRELNKGKTSEPTIVMPSVLIVWKFVRSLEFKFAKLPSTIEFSKERKGAEIVLLPSAIPPPITPAELPVIVVLTKLPLPKNPPPDLPAELPEIVLFTTVSDAWLRLLSMPPPLFAVTLSVIKLLDICASTVLRLMAPPFVPSFSAKTLFVIASELGLLEMPEPAIKAPVLPELLVKEELSIAVVVLPVETTVPRSEMLLSKVLFWMVSVFGNRIAAVSYTHLTLPTILLV